MPPTSEIVGVLDVLEVVSTAAPVVAREVLGFSVDVVVAFEVVVGEGVLVVVVVAGGLVDDTVLPESGNEEVSSSCLIPL